MNHPGEPPLLTPAIRNYIVSQFDDFNGLQYDLNEDEDSMIKQIWIVFFLDNWSSLPPEMHIKIAAKVKETIETLRNQGVPIGFGRIATRADNA